MGEGGAWAATGVEGVGSTSFDTGLWLVIDMVVGRRRAVQIGLVLGLCLVAHYIWAVCYPVVSVVVALVMALIWLCRKLLRWLETSAFWLQRVTGGSPEASEAEFHGPGTGRRPETSQLRAFKRTGEAFS